MGKLVFTVLAICSFFVAFSQKDPELKKRLDTFMQFSSVMNIEKILDYTYPKLFTIVKRTQLRDALENSLHNDVLDAGLDGIKLDSLYPVFRLKEGSYAKVRYSVNMIMKLKYSKELNTDEKKKDFRETMYNAVQKQFGPGKVSKDNKGNIVVAITTEMVAIKDQYAKEWCFTNLKMGDPLNEKLFSKELLDKFATYK